MGRKGTDNRLVEDKERQAARDSRPADRSRTHRIDYPERIRVVLSIGERPFEASYRRNALQLHVAAASPRGYSRRDEP